MVQGGEAVESALVAERRNLVAFLVGDEGFINGAVYGKRGLALTKSLS